MKIIILNGSPRPNGYTASLVSKFEEGAKVAGHQTCVLQVGTMKIAGCIACEACHDSNSNECVFKDDMQAVYNEIKDADMVVFASPVYYWGLSGQLQSTISRFYAPEKPQKATKYGLILTSASDDVYNSIISQYNDIVDYFNAVDMGIITAYGSQRYSDEKLEEAYEFGKRL